MDLQPLGAADLLNAFYQANRAGLLPGQLGATYFIPTFVVPLLLITHGLTFRILLQHQNVPAVKKTGAWHEALGHRKECYSCCTGRSTAGGDETGELNAG